ncbi:histidine phosphatase superfamily [Crepidotus variabilis]|uniref:Histidine phosphatase superfamily n=1 Tax=Crepidotus variabilis TaxID=179855 RepID=A0A9P6JTJ1_9AGAR|nr:histidine phosphatase superfamily [Crepidotus variabilis]
MPDKIYIARHGFRLNWITTVWKSPTGLPRDPPLAAYGEAQAEELAKHFLSLPEDQRPTAIFSSPYYRCIQTAQPTSQHLNIPLYIEHGLSEWYSPVAPSTGLHPRPSSAQSLTTYFPSINTTWSPVYYPTRKGETIEELHDRIDEFLQGFYVALIERLPEEQRKRPLFVSHAATVIALARSLVGDRELPLKVGCATLSEFVPKEGAWKALELASGKHLAKGADREWGFEYVEVDKGRVVEDPGEGENGEKDEPLGLQIKINPPGLSSSL